MRSPGSLIYRLPVVTAVMMVFVNDRWLKHVTWCPPWVSGKASDVAGLFAFPIVAGAVLELATRRVFGRTAYALIAAGTALVFAMTKLNAWTAGIVGRFWGWLLSLARLVGGAASTARPVGFAPDRTDLIALASCILAVEAVRRWDRVDRRA
jgi:hypothetical protein